MLIPSERHRPEDLRLWAELEEADAAHGGQLLRSGRIETAVAAIREFAAAGPCYCSTSWGKDSVVLAHLVWLSGARVPLVWIRAEPTGNPCTPRVRDAFLARFDIDYGEMTAVYQTGEGEQEKDRTFYACFKPWGGRHLSAIRAEESAGRRARMRRWGLASPNACAPIGNWRSADVFGYLAIHDLPIHPNYAMTAGGRWQREHLRVDELAGERGDQFGRAAWETEYFGDVLRRLAR